MAAAPNVDVNMMVYNCVDTVGAAIECVLAQTWPSVSLTLFDNSSTDGTPQVLLDYLLADVERFEANAPQHDDITCVLVKCQPVAGSL